MRILLFPSAYLPALGGVEELTRHLALELTRSGDEVEVWTGRMPASDLASVEQMDGITVRRFLVELPALDAGALLRFPPLAFRTLRAMRSVIAQWRPELIHVQCFGPNGAYALALAELTRLPLVVTLQGETLMDNDDVYDHSVVLRTALRAGIARASAVTGCSKFTLDDVERRFGLAPARGKVVFNGVGGSDSDSGGAGDSAAEPRPEGGATSLLGISPSRRYVLAVGRVVEKKGFDLLVEAFSRVAASHADTDLVIGGEGPALASLRELARSRGLEDRVAFPGRLARDDVGRAMSGAALFVMPSRLEPFGIVALEGWRAGTPVVATSRGGAGEFVREGEDGLLVDPFDTEAFAKALDALLSDADLARRLGAAGRARVPEFSWPVIAGQYRSIYEEVLSSSATRGRSSGT
ncbi:MAG: glycosyltransferase family 4 protein [Acidimicrobiales bacterium]